MDSEVRKRALARLAQSKTPASQQALAAEFEQIARTLGLESDYSLIVDSLSRLHVIGFRFSKQTVALIETFVRSIESRTLRYPADQGILGEFLERHNNALTLIANAVEVVAQLRYFETPAVLLILLNLSEHPDEGVRKKVSDALSALAGYNIDVFYGTDGYPGLGAQPQGQVVETLEAVEDSELVRHSRAILNLLSGVLSPTIEGTSWTSQTVRLSRGQIPAESQVSEVRARAIRLTKRLYTVARSIGQKLAAISVLNNATRTESTQEINEETRTMVARSSIEVLQFFEQLVEQAELPIVQRIEHDSYWTFVHAVNDDVRKAALRVESALKDHREYAIYRQLVGFQGIFGDWATLRERDDDWSTREAARRSRASEFAKSITPQTYEVWRARILNYAMTESDDLATFPIFYHFLSEFAVAQPELALRLITTDTRAMALFLIPILRGLWEGGGREATRSLIVQWIGEAETHKENRLSPSVKLFLSTKDVDVPLIDLICTKAIEIGEVVTIRQCMAVVIARYPSQTVDLKRLFFRALDALTQFGDAGWIYDSWFRAEAKQLLAELGDDELARVLNNLHLLPKVDHHADYLLAAIATRHPGRVIEFFCDRLRKQESQGKRIDEYEPVPYQFYKLQGPLSKAPGVAVRIVLDLYQRDDSLFVYRGARILTNIFPKFPPEFESELLSLLRDGQESYVEFVLAILRNYHGECFIHSICREIVKVIPSDSPLRSSVAIALESTGVVYGEFGISDAYERKRQEVLDWLNDPNERVRDFAEWYSKSLEQMRDSEKSRAEEEIVLRKFHYGEE